MAVRQIQTSQIDTIEVSPHALRKLHQPKSAASHSDDYPSISTQIKDAPPSLETEVFLPNIQAAHVAQQLQDTVAYRKILQVLGVVDPCLE